jgi:hypothetical protein
MAIGTAAAIALGVGALGSAAIGASAASKAGKYQERAADKGVEEQRAAREEMRRLLEPYVAAGGPALEAQMGALGLRGAEAQQAYVSEQEQSPIYQALKRQQEESIYRTPQQLADFVAATFKVHWLSSALHCLTSFLHSNTTV